VIALPRQSGKRHKDLSKVKLGENLELTDEKVIACSRCGHKLCDDSENWKSHSVARSVRQDLLDLNLIKLHGDLQLLEYICPQCGVLLDVELLRKDDQPLWSAQLG